MTLDNYIELAVRGGGISLATYAIIGHIVKPALRMIAKRGGRKLSRRKEEFLRWLTRTMCILLGALLGALPLWPGWFAQEWWGILLGAIGGSMAPAIHHAVAKTLPARIKKIISGGSINK